jgi:hypothetical protein
VPVFVEFVALAGSGRTGAALRALAISSDVKMSMCFN